MSRVAAAIRTILTDPRLFSDLVIGISLRPYQLEPVLAIADSVLNGCGRQLRSTPPCSFD